MSRDFNFEDNKLEMSHVFDRPAYAGGVLRNNDDSQVRSMSMDAWDLYQYGWSNSVQSVSTSSLVTQGTTAFQALYSTGLEQFVKTAAASAQQEARQRSISVSLSCKSC